MENYLDNYLTICDNILESAQSLRALLTELKNCGEYDDNTLYDAFIKFDSDVKCADGLTYMGIGTRIKRLVQSLDD